MGSRFQRGKFFQKLRLQKGLRVRWECNVALGRTLIRAAELGLVPNPSPRHTTPRILRAAVHSCGVEFTFDPLQGVEGEITSIRGKPLHRVLRNFLEILRTAPILHPKTQLSWAARKAAKTADRALRARNL